MRYKIGRGVGHMHTHDRFALDVDQQLGEGSHGTIRDNEEDDIAPSISGSTSDDSLDSFDDRNDADNWDRDDMDNWDRDFADGDDEFLAMHEMYGHSEFVNM